MNFEDKYIENKYNEDKYIEDENNEIAVIDNYISINENIITNIWSDENI